MKKKFKKTIPETCHLEVISANDSGELWAKTVEQGDNPEGHKIYVLENRRIKPPFEVGDKFIARISRRPEGFVAKPIARTATATTAADTVYGVIENRENKCYLKATEKNIRMDYLLEDIGPARPGDFVAVALVGERRFKEARIIKNFGKFDLNKATATLVLEKHGIPLEFPENVFRETTKLPQFEAGLRLDLTDVPLVTIDGDDSKDFDDAVWAKKTINGFNLIVAIADVAFYVREGSELDREAYKRGNSVYLPNVVVPMLPEILSNDLCSLNPNQCRAAVVCMIEIDNEGNLRDFNFKRAVIKSAARLTYKEVQSAIEGNKNEKTAPLYKNVIEPLYEAYLALDKARKKRGALELEIEEVKVKVDKNGMVKSIEPEENLTSNKLIEEFMVAANVAAAKVLGKTKLPVMYRIHEAPRAEKLEDIKPLLHNLKMKLPDPTALKPSHFNKIIEKCSINGGALGISNLILRLQSQAKYSPENIGHFGLGLTDYAHFTSPIRRYADLLIHRALIRACKMEDGGALSEEAGIKLFEETAEHLCVTERRAVSAERDITARFISAYMQPAIGQDFEVKVSGMSAAGMFVRISAIGAEGLVPLSSFPDDRYDLAEGNVELKGQKTGLSFKMGDVIKCRLMEATPLTGGLIFKYVDPEDGVEYAEKSSWRNSYSKPKAVEKKVNKHKKYKKKNKKVEKAKR